MKVDTKNLMSMTQANRNFSLVARNVEKNGSVIILKNNKPTYIVSKIEDYENKNKENKDKENEMVLAVANLILTEHKDAFLELAK